MNLLNDIVTVVNRTQLITLKNVLNSISEYVNYCWITVNCLQLQFKNPVLEADISGLVPRPSTPPKAGGVEAWAGICLHCLHN